MTSVANYIAYLMNGHPPAHGCQDAVNVVLSQIFSIECTRKIAYPEVADNLIHGARVFRGSSQVKNTEVMIDNNAKTNDSQRLYA